MAVEARYTTWYGLRVVDEETYARYREAMTPILRSYGGAFGHDFVVSKVLKSEAHLDINRVFMLVFDDPKASERFFADPNYQRIRSELFVPSVAPESVAKL